MRGGLYLIKRGQPSQIKVRFNFKTQIKLQIKRSRRNHGETNHYPALSRHWVGQPRRGYSVRHLNTLHANKNSILNIDGLRLFLIDAGIDFNGVSYKYDSTWPASRKRLKDDGLSETGLLPVLEYKGAILTQVHRPSQ